MTQTGGLVILYAWLIFAALLAVLGYLLSLPSVASGARLTCRQLGEVVQGHRGGRAAPFGSNISGRTGPGACAGAAACAGRQSQNLPGACMISMPNLPIQRLRAVPRSRTASPVPAGRRPSPCVRGGDESA
jgi:hypothetical protein